MQNKSNDLNLDSESECSGNKKQIDNFFTGDYFLFSVYLIGQRMWKKRNPN